MGGVCWAGWALEGGAGKKTCVLVNALSFLRGWKTTPTHRPLPLVITPAAAAPCGAVNL